MQNLHEPDPDFTRFLEWQTRTELRRHDRFTPPSAPPRIVRVARIAALVVASLICGAGVVVAAERIQESREVEIILERNAIRLQLAERRVEAAIQVQDRARLLFEQGFVSQSEMVRSEGRLAGIERDRDQLRLDRDEMLSSRREVDERLSASLVGARDFVSEHLRVDRAYLERLLESHAVQEAVVHKYHDAGFVSSSELADAQHAVAVAGDDVAYIDALLAIRADFVLGRIDASVCDTLDLVANAESRRTRLERDVARVGVLLAQARRNEAAGIASGEVAPLQGELDSIEVELQLIELELELLR